MNPLLILELSFRGLNRWKWPKSNFANFSHLKPNLEIFITILAVPGHALLWLSLVKSKRKKKESTRFEYIYFDNATGQGCI